MRRIFLIVAIFELTGLANSAAGQDSTARDTARRDPMRRDTTCQDTTRQDTTHHRTHKCVRATSPGEVDTAKIRAPSRRDSSLVRREMHVDTVSAGKDTSARPTKPPPDTTRPKKPEG